MNGYDDALLLFALLRQNRRLFLTRWSLLKKKWYADLLAVSKVLESIVYLSDFSISRLRHIEKVYIKSYLPFSILRADVFPMNIKSLIFLFSLQTLNQPNNFSGDLQL